MTIETADFYEMAVERLAAMGIAATRSPTSRGPAANRATT
jgi:hypothetical protein